MVPDRQPPDLVQPLFSRLPQGPSDLSRAEIAANQRAQLMGAMQDAAGRNGFQGATVGEVVALAGVPRKIFYQHFDSMQDCLLAMIDAIMERAGARIGRAYASGTGSDYRLRFKAAFETYVDLLLEEPVETRLLLIEMPGLGEVGLAHAQRSSEGLEMLLAQGFADATEKSGVPNLTIRGIVGGFTRVVYRRFRSGEAERLRDDFDELLDWSLGYRRRQNEDAVGVGTNRAEPGQVRTAKRPSRSEAGRWTLNGSGSLATLSKRERVIRAAATIVEEGGYSGLNITAITRTAGVSTESFYKYFANTEEAFLKALEILGWRVLARVKRAGEAQDSWPDAVRAQIEELLTCLSEDPGLARLLFIEAYNAGTAALDLIHLTLETFADISGLSEARTAEGARIPPVVVNAICGGVFIILQREVVKGRTATLPELASRMSFFVLNPYGLA